MKRSLVMVGLFLSVAGITCARRAAAEAPVPGDHHETYRLAGAALPMTFRVYVPARWRKGVALPLVILLHGYHQSADGPFDAAPPDLRGRVQREAERYGFIVAAPAGYDGTSDYGANLPLPHPLPPGPGSAAGTVRPSESSALAEQDVMQVRARVLRGYGADPRRVYLMGNSMGMTGVLHLAKRYPNRWCAIEASDGPPWPDYPVERLADLAGALFVNGENDTLALSATNRALADRVRAAGVDTRFLEVPSGTHSSSWYTVLPQIFAFFDAHRCNRH